VGLTLARDEAITRHEASRARDLPWLDTATEKAA
jgi:hypothetical protein